MIIWVFSITLWWGGLTCKKTTPNVLCYLVGSFSTLLFLQEDVVETSCSWNSCSFFAKEEHFDLFFSNLIFELVGFM